MALVHFEVAYHLVNKPDYTHVIRLLTSDDPASVDEYLVRKYGPGNVVLHYSMLEKERTGHERTCGYCMQTRTVYENEPRQMHAGMFDKSLWRQL